MQVEGDAAEFDVGLDDRVQWAGAVGDCGERRTTLVVVGADSRPAEDSTTVTDQIVAGAAFNAKAVEDTAQVGVEGEAFSGKVLWEQGGAHCACCPVEQVLDRRVHPAGGSLIRRRPVGHVGSGLNLRKP